ncbi:unnamed protein product [Victoria cruziana]
MEMGKHVSGSIALLHAPAIHGPEMINVCRGRNSAALYAAKNEYCCAEDSHDLSLSLHYCHPPENADTSQEKQNDLNMRFSDCNSFIAESVGDGHNRGHMKKIGRSNSLTENGCIYIAWDSSVAMQIASTSELASSRVSIRNSRFLPVTQSLLDEAVRISKVIVPGVRKQCFLPTPYGVADSRLEGLTMCTMTDQLVVDREGLMADCLHQFSFSRRKDLCIRFEKLFSLLDEVEKRYQEYNSRMEKVMPLFEDAAGGHAAKSYISPAQHTVHGYFQSLRDAILSQIYGTKRRLTVDSRQCMNVAPKFRPIDLHIRQGKAPTYLGMWHSHSQRGWRPLRGLPENSVAILRAWLFEHFLHPYPNDSEKIALATQTGLTRNQVSNWFINARVRLWKPMIEEIYREEIEHA